MHGASCGAVGLAPAVRAGGAVSCGHWLTMELEYLDVRC